MTSVLRVLIPLIFLAVSVSASTSLTPSKNEKCPVCGMFVAKYRDWLAAIRFSDGSTLYFDGMKDLFTYYFSLTHTDRSGKKRAIKEILATDYYDLSPIDARRAFFVIGSDVYGPMGKELIPFSSRNDAELFLRDHHGKKILTFEEITPRTMELIK